MFRVIYDAILCQIYTVTLVDAHIKDYTLHATSTHQSTHLQAAFILCNLNDHVQRTCHLNANEMADPALDQVSDHFQSSSCLKSAF